jgi:hypothetical protein
MATLPMPKKIRWIILFFIIAFILPFVGKAVHLIVDYLWFKELNLTTLFTTTLVAQIGCGTAVGILAFALIFGNIILADRISRRSQRYTTFSGLSLVRFFQAMPVEKTLLFIASILVALLLSGWAFAEGESFLRFRSAVPFGINDQLFGRDIGFYMFQLPFLKAVYFFAIVILVFSFIGASLVYLLRRNVGTVGFRLIVASGPRTHLLTILGIICLSLFFLFQFRMFSMVTAAGAIVNGAGYAQIKAGIPILSALRFIAAIAAILIWITIFRQNFKPLYAGLVLLILAGFLSKGTVSFVQKFIVNPDELGKEAPYIAWSIANTRAAFGLNNIETKHFAPTDAMDANILENNAATVNNIRLWDHAPLLTTYSQLQEIRTYYEFLDVDNDRYRINNEYRQVMLSPRELVPASLPSRTWINEHLTYTHGYGVCLGPVNSVTAEGLPDFFIKNIPPSSTIDHAVSRPEIYYGEADAGYAIVKTGAKEFDYPSGNDNIYSVYSGTGGIRVGGLFRKALLSLYLHELKILLRGDIGPESRILLNRQIMARIQKAVPFLRFDADPYMVITRDGRLVWILDGYTASSAYPYSAMVGTFGNYMRNSVKAVIDAYNGTISLYAWDNADPILKTYAAIYPGVFKSRSEMPEDLAGHVRYPQTLFTAQAYIYSVYHMTDPQVFYNKEDVWRMPGTYGGENTESMKPYYTVMKLAETGKKEEFILMVPFCPSKKENMIAWLAARCDEPNYGRLLVFDFPKQKLVYGPSQIESRINQDPEISKQLTLWNQGGSRVIRGSLLVIPIEQSLIYVQPLYIASQNGGVPELKRVLAAFENKIAMEETLEKSLLRIFGESQPEQMSARTTDDSASPAGWTAGIRELIAEASRQFDAAQTEQKRGNWAGYGEALKKLEKALAELSAQAR